MLSVVRSLAIPALFPWILWRFPAHPHRRRKLALEIDALECHGEYVDDFSGSARMLNLFAMPASDLMYRNKGGNSKYQCE